MQIIVLAHFLFNRLGSASRRGTVNHVERRFVTKISGTDLETIKKVLIAFAEQHGENKGALDKMQERQDSWRYTAYSGARVFDVDTPGIQYGSPYAICHTSPALEADGRFFELTEVAIDAG